MRLAGVFQSGSDFESLPTLHTVAVFSGLCMNRKTISQIKWVQKCLESGGLILGNAQRVDSVRRGLELSCFYACCSAVLDTYDSRYVLL